MNQCPKTLWIKRRFLEQILSGEKTVEVRVGYRNIQTIKKENTVLLNEEREMKIKDVRRYPSLEAMIKHEDAEKIVPGMTKDEVLKILKTIYPPNREKLGVFAIELESKS